MADTRRTSARRSYRPKVEALEALRLLDAGLLPAALAASAVEVGGATQAGEIAVPDADRLAAEAAWDAALSDSEVGSLLGRGVAPRSIDVEPEPEAIRNGLHQLTRYLGRAWARAGIEPQHFEDCTQEVYETLLGHLGRDGFDQLAEEVGHHGVRTVLNRDTAEGPDFFRAIDMVKKRTQRLKTFQSLDEQYLDIADRAGGDGASASGWRGELDEAIERSLSTREADLIRETLMGRTPQEIAQSWGVAPKTVSNEKTRAIAKLRDALTDDDS